MSYWFHRNPLKATAYQPFDIKMFAHDPDAIKICGDLKNSRARVLELLPDPHHNIEQVETALRLYMCLLRGFLLEPKKEEDGPTAPSKLRHTLTFRWTDSLLGQSQVSLQKDAVFELASILMNTSFWFMKHAVMIAVKSEISMDDAKEVHTSLRKAAGHMKFVQDTLLSQLDEKLTEGSDLDGRVLTAYINQCTAEAQEVTIARAIELHHNAGLVSALANETSKMFGNAANAISSLDQRVFGHWRMYFELKSNFYLAYAYNYQGEALLGQDKCGEAIRSLQESKRLYQAAANYAQEYATVKGPGTKAKPEQHTFFRRLAPILNRTLEKCERENGFIYHQKVPFDPVELEMNSKTHGLVSPEMYELPTVSPLWTAVAYAAFDESNVGKNKDKSKSRAEKKAEEEVKPVKEVPIDDKEAKHDNESGCVIS